LAQSPRIIINPWIPLHKYAVEHQDDWDPVKAKRWYKCLWLPTVPRFTPDGAACGCVTHWQELTEENPPDFSSSEAFFAWTVDRHNDVSRLYSHKQTITLEEAIVLYKLLA
jgi:hypothetical protein